MEAPQTTDQGMAPPPPSPEALFAEPSTNFKIKTNKDVSSRLLDQLMANQAITYTEAGQYEASNALLIEILKKKESDQDGTISYQLAKSLSK